MGTKLCITNDFTSFLFFCAAAISTMLVAVAAVDSNLGVSVSLSQMTFLLGTKMIPSSRLWSMQEMPKGS